MAFTWADSVEEWDQSNSDEYGRSLCHWAQINFRLLPLVFWKWYGKVAGQTRISRLIQVSWEWQHQDFLLCFSRYWNHMQDFQVLIRRCSICLRVSYFHFMTFLFCLLLISDTLKHSGGGVFFWRGKEGPVGQPRQPHGGLQGFLVFSKILMISNIPLGSSTIGKPITNHYGSVWDHPKRWKPLQITKTSI